MLYRMNDETEFVGYGQGVDDQTASGQGEGLGQMSERVQAMAQTLYEQLEFLVSRYGVEAAQAITPMLVRLLESEGKTRSIFRISQKPDQSYRNFLPLISVLMKRSNIGVKSRRILSWPRQIVNNF